MTDPEIETRREMNRTWRENHEPSDASRAAVREVIETGSLSDEARKAVVDELVKAIPERQCDLSRDAGDNGLLSLVNPVDDGIELRISNGLFNMQPLGVISRPVHHRVNGEGSAVITDACPRSADVSPDIMEEEHICLRIVPTAVWLNRFIGVEDGFDPANAD